MDPLRSRRDYTSGDGSPPMKRLPRLIRLAAVLAVALATALSACGGPRATAGRMQIEVLADGSTRTYDVPAGSTVDQALQASGFELEALDRTDPPGYTVLTDGARVKVTRVTEVFEFEEIVIPFERQTVRNEALPDGDTRLLQPGINGTQEVTYRIVLEDGEEVSRTPVKRTILEPPQAEIVMVGAQADFAPVPISGRLVYLAGGNAWLLEGNTGNRQPLVLSGDLDGRIFDLSPDGSWLLFTRAAPEDSEDINSLWALRVDTDDPEPIDLEAANIVHFGAWSPASPRLTLAYSTVESSPAAPGWQANNDLVRVILTQTGRILDRETLIEPNAGGQYGWWGTDYTWAEDGARLAFARADAIGQVDVQDPELETVVDLVPFQTLSDWAWVPGLTWGRDSRTLFFVDHGEPVGLEEPDASPIFNLAALTADGERKLPLVGRAGMFASPSVSPSESKESEESAYQVAFLQAKEPLQSQDSSYRVAVIDRDGSNRRLIFPPAEDAGLRGDDLQQPPVWSPDGRRLAVVYQGDLWLIELQSGQSQQITGDGSTAAVDWK